VGNVEGIRAAITIATIIGYVILWIAMIREVATAPEQAFTNGDKTTWLALVIVTGIIGFIAYRVYGRRQ
jgi:Phospholipase_D-nuclease N-terminal